jgi:hypothetical protein
VYRGCAEDKCAVAAAVDNARVELAGEENGRLVGRAITSLCAVVKRGRGVGGGGERARRRGRWREERSWAAGWSSDIDG